MKSLFAYSLLLVLFAGCATRENSGSDTLLSSADYHHSRGNLKNSQFRFEQEQSGTVAFLGGSITYNGGWRDSVMAYLEQRFPETDFNFIPAGISSMGTTPSAFRLERDVISQGPVDLLFVEAAVNDATNGRTTVEQLRAMEGVVRHLKNVNPSVDIVMMHFVDPDKMEEYRSGREPEVITNHNQVASHYGIPTINLAREVTDRIDQGEFTWEEDFKNLHPSPFGQGVYARSIIEFLDNSFHQEPGADDAIQARALPGKLDQWCYDQGILVDISEAQISPGWEAVPFWEPDDSTGTRNNYTGVPMLVSQEPGSALSFHFRGNAVGIAVAAGQDAGIITYRIDQGPWQTQNLFTKWSSQLHLPWYYTLAAGLPGDEHLLEIQIESQKDPQSNGNACRIRYFFVNQSLSGA